MQSQVSSSSLSKSSRVRRASALVPMAGSRNAARAPMRLRLRGLASGLVALVWTLSLWPAAGAASAEGIKLLGSWHVTVHFRDDSSENPDTERWDDRVWRFEKKGSRLQWSEFPIVVFDDQSGRFEAHEGDRRRRILHFWEPNASQREEIRKGLLVNPRGMKSKGLRGSARAGYRSAGGMRAESASMIGYSESWTIEGLPDRPVFTRDDMMGSGSSESMQGRTQYSGTEVSADGKEVRGTYVRDGSRQGTFVMRRSSDAIVMGGRRDHRKKGAK